MELLRSLPRTSRLLVVLSTLTIMLFVDSSLVFADGEDGCHDPGGPCSGCGCDDEGSAADGSESTDSTTRPVNFLLNSAVETEVDLQIPGIGVNWKHKRTYDSRLARASGTFVDKEGVRWHGDAVGPYLRFENESTDPPRLNIELYVSARNKIIFEYDSGNNVYLAPPDSPHTLVRNNQGTSGETFTLTNRETGKVSIFYGLYSSIEPELKGKLKERTTRDIQAAGGTGITYSYLDNSGLVDWVLTSQGWRVQYAYYGPGHDIGRLKSISVHAGPLTSDTLVQHAEYLYFNSLRDSEDHEIYLSSDVGSTGDLVQVRVRKRATADSGNAPEDLSIVRVTQYRYYNGDTESPENNYGQNQHQLKAVFEADAVERLLTDNSNLTEPEEILEQADSYSTGSGLSKTVLNFSSRSFTHYDKSMYETDVAQATAWGTETLETKYGGYDFYEWDVDWGGAQVDDMWDGVVKSETINAGCASCGSESNTGVTKEYRYIEIADWYEMEHLTQPSSASDPNQVSRVIIEDTIDSTGPRYRKLYGINYRGTAIREVLITDPMNPSATNIWCKSIILSPDWRVVERRMPSAHKYDGTKGVNSNATVAKFLNPTGNSNANDTDTVSTSQGVVYHYEFDSNHGSGGRPTGERVSQGTGGTKYYVSAKDYGDGDADTGGFDDDEGKLLVATYQYPTQTTSRSSGDKTSYSYTFWDGNDTSIKTKTTSFPKVPNSQNGAGDGGGDSAISMTEYYDNLGRLRWTKDGEGYVNYFSYHPSLGTVSYEAIDVNNPASPGSEITSGSSGKWIDWTVGDADSNYPTRGGGLPTGLGLITKKEFDSQGRLNLETTPGGSKHYTIYKSNATLRFPYWDTSTNKPILPIEVSYSTPYGVLSENFTVIPAQATHSSGVPTGYSGGQNYYLSWTRYFHNKLNGQLVKNLRYHAIPSSGSGSHLTNYYVSAFKYDTLGRKSATVQTVQSATGFKDQITEITYDLLDREITRKSDSGNSGVDTDADSDLGTLSLGGLTTVSETTYDAGNVGDSHITKTRTYHTSSVYTDMTFHRTVRGFLRGQARSYYSGSASDVTPFTVADVDWMGRTVASAVYTSAPTWSTVLGDDDYAATITTGGRNNLNKTHYDKLGRVYRTDQFPGTQGSNHIEINNYYDRNSRLVATGDKYGAHTEFAYDGASRQTQVRTVKNTSSSSPFDSGKFVYCEPLPGATNIDAGGMIEYETTSYDSSGNALETNIYEVVHTNTHSGIVLGDTDSYIRHTIFHWYDGADRLIATADYGSGNGDTDPGENVWKWSTPASRPGGAPSSSDAGVNVVKYSYHPAERMESTVDPQGVETRQYFDDLGRRTAVVENYYDYDYISPLVYIGGGTDNDEDRLTNWSYNGLDQVVSLTAYNGSSSADQVTRYLYEDTVHASLVTNTIYPDSSDTTSSGGDQIKNAYNLDGSLATMTDQRGVVHTYVYNTRRQLELDRATTIPSGVDNSVKSIKRTYDLLGRMEYITSYANNDGTGTVHNEVKLSYSSIGRVSKSQQSHEGVVGGSTPDVDYDYDDTVSSNVYTNGLRQVEMVYPLVTPSATKNPKIVWFYGSADDTDDRLNRVRYHKQWSGSFTTTDDATYTSKYDYNGSGRLVGTETNYTTNNDVVDQQIASASGIYSGFDRFGRVLQSKWYKSSTVKDQFDYTYNYAGNRLTRDVPATLNTNNDRDQKYTYDLLHRVRQTNTGTLASSPLNITDAAAKFRQKWGLDQLGNWSKFEQDGTKDYVTVANDSFADATDVDQDREHNDINEITSVEGNGGLYWEYVEHDAAGNMVWIPGPQGLMSSACPVYDAWNRMVNFDGSGRGTPCYYEYDGLNRMIVKNDGTTTTHFYYNEEWQVILEAEGTSTITPTVMYSYHPHYVDAIAHRMRANDSHAYLHDANYNVTAILDSSGNVVERYDYTPYGEAIILDANFAPDSIAGDGLSDISNTILYTGRWVDPFTGLQLNRNRWYHQQLGRWVTRDPIKYGGGSPNLFQYSGSNPAVLRDPSGLASICVATFSPEGSRSFDFPSPPGGDGCYELRLSMRSCTAVAQFTIPLVPNGCHSQGHNLSRIKEVRCVAKSDCPPDTVCKIKNQFNLQYRTSRTMTIPTPTCIIIGVLDCLNEIDLRSGACECPEDEPGSDEDDSEDPLNPFR